MNVVSLRHSGASSNCQYPLLASKQENTLAPCSLAISSSGVGIMYLSRFTERFNFFKSTQILTSRVSVFQTGTIGALQSLWSVTRSMTSSLIICSSSSLTNSYKLGYGTAPSLILIITGSVAIFPQRSTLVPMYFTTTFSIQLLVR